MYIYFNHEDVALFFTVHTPTVPPCVGVIDHFYAMEAPEYVMKKDVNRRYHEGFPLTINVKGNKIERGAQNTS